MAAIIEAAIGSQNFEAIRNQIAAVIALEYAAQKVLQPTLPAVKAVWLERCTPIDSSHEVPLINVTVSRGEYENQTVKKAIGEYLYNIDVYTNAYTTSSLDGDKKAMLDMTRVMGVVRAILSYPDYYCLGLTPGIIEGIPRIKRMYVANKDMAEDALFNVVGRIQFVVRMIENTGQLLQAGEDLITNTTTTTLQESEDGFYYEITDLDA